MVTIDSGGSLLDRLVRETEAEIKTLETGLTEARNVLRALNGATKQASNPPRSRPYRAPRSVRHTARREPRRRTPVPPKTAQSSASHDAYLAAITRVGDGEFTVEDIAGLTGKSVGSVGSKLRRLVADQVLVVTRPSTIVKGGRGRTPVYYRKKETTRSSA